MIEGTKKMKEIDEDEDMHKEKMQNMNCQDFLLFANKQIRTLASSLLFFLTFKFMINGLCEVWVSGLALRCQFVAQTLQGDIMMPWLKIYGQQGAGA